MRARPKAESGFAKPSQGQHPKKKNDVFRCWQLPVSLAAVFAMPTAAHRARFWAPRHQEALVNGALNFDFTHRISGVVHVKLLSTNH
jgi:hypothetical protein